MFSKKAKYGLKALLALARGHGQGPILISDLAAREGIPKKFLELILLDLKHNGILQSKKGRGGGYFLGRPPQTVTVGAVVRILDGTLAPMSCVSQIAYRKCDECRDEKTCEIRAVMKELREAMVRILDHTSLADMLGYPGETALHG